MELAMPIFACVIVLFGLIRRVPERRNTDTL